MHDLATIIAMNMREEQKEIEEAFKIRQQVNAMLERATREVEETKDNK